ncbi:MAG: cobalamin-binding protein [Chloroflexota bacterium]
MRIASLLPSATEIVCALGLGDELVGVTHECDWPPEVADKPRLTHDLTPTPGAPSAEIHRLVSDAIHSGSALYALDEGALQAAEPDLVLTQELCKVCAVGYEEVNEVVRTIPGDVTVVSLEPSSIEGILNTITTVGAMTEAEDAAIDLVASLRERLRTVEERVLERRDAGRRPRRVVGVEWLDPPFATGHWVPEQIRLAGGWDVLGAEGERSRETSWDAIRDVDPELLVLMPCGFDLDATVAEWARTPRPDGWETLLAVRNGAVHAVDGSGYFSRPGPRVVDGVELLAALFDPEAFADLAAERATARVG